MIFEYKRTKRVKPHIDHTPLIDCVFNLLIFFAVSTSLITTRAGMDVHLPKAATAEIMPKNIVITIKEDQNIYFEDPQGGRLQVSLVSLETLVREEIKKSPQTSFIINADKKTSYDVLIQVMDTIRKGGGEKLALAAEKSPEAK